MKPLTRATLEQKTKKQLRAYADGYLGIILSMQKSKDDMINMILQQSPKGSAEFIDEVPEEQTQAYARRHNLPAAAVGVPPGKVRLVIQKTHQNQKARPVFLSHNGHTMLVKPGREVDFPAKRLSCLVDAIEYRSIWDDELATATGDGGYKMTAAPSYPYSIIGYGPGTEDAREMVESANARLVDLAA